MRVEVPRWEFTEPTRLPVYVSATKVTMPDPVSGLGTLLASGDPLPATVSELHTLASFFLETESMYEENLYKFAADQFGWPPYRHLFSWEKLAFLEYMRLPVHLRGPIGGFGLCRSYLEYPRGEIVLN